MINALQRKNIFLIIGVLFLSVSGVFQMNMGSSYAIHGNDVIDGGVQSEEELQATIADDSNNPHAHHIFNKAFNKFVTPQDMTGMVEGRLHRDGRVTVNGKTVATDAHTSGRETFTAHDQILARDADGNPVAYHAPVPHRFATDAEEPDLLVKLDENGKYQHAVLKDCGNPVIAEPVPVEEPEPEPAFKCQDLQADDTRGTVPLTVNFTVSADVENTEIEGYEFRFGDGSDERLFVTSKSELTVPHTYDRAGTFTARANVITKAGNTGFNQSQCRVDITVEEEPEPEAVFECDSLTADDTFGRGQLTTTFTADADVENTSIVRYEWNFGDGNTDATSNNRTAHTYTEPGTYTAKVNVVTEDGETGFTDQCEVRIKVKKELEPEPEEEVSFACKNLSASDAFGRGSLKTVFTADAKAKNTTITGYEWDFGDGATTTTTGNQVTHTYTEPSRHVARVNVITDHGETGFTTQCKVAVKVGEEPEPEPEEEEQQQQQQQQQGDGGQQQQGQQQQGDGQQQQQQQQQTVNVNQSVQVEHAVQRQDQDQDRQRQQQQQQVASKRGELPNTGIGSTAMALMGSASLGVGLRGWLRSRKQLLKSMLSN